MYDLSKTEKSIIEHIEKQHGLLRTWLGLLLPLASAMKELGLEHIPYASIKRIFNYLGVNDV